MSTPFRTFLKFSVGTWLNALISVISIPIITWFVLPEELGKATMFTLAFNLLLNIFLLGQDQSFARHFNEVRPEQRPALLLNAVTSAFVCSLIGVALLEVFRYFISDLLFSSTQLAHYIDLLSVTLIAGVLNRFSQLILRMSGRALAFSILQVVLSASNLLVTILYASLIKADFSAIIVGFVASQIICLVAGCLLERRTWITAVRSRVDREDVRGQLKFGLPFVPTFVFDWLFQSTDRAFLRMYSTFSEIGLYATATRISAALGVVQTGFNTFWVPFVYERFSKNEHDKSFYQLVFESVYLVFSVAIILLLATKDLILFILPSEYAKSIDIFPLVVFVPMLYTLSEISGVGINLRKKTIYHFYILMASAVISIALGFFLIRAFGAKGAIITNFCSYCAFFLLRTLLGAKLYPLPLNWKKFTITFVVVLVAVLYTFIWPRLSPYVVLGTSLLVVLMLHRRSIRQLMDRVDFRKWQT